MARARKTCSVPGCPEIVDAGRCARHRREADLARGTSSQRGYASVGHRSFRADVIARDPICVLCRQRPSTQADHWPRSRRELQALGLDPNDPRHGRGLCERCHSRETARHQPGGWNADPAWGGG